MGAAVNYDLYASTASWWPGERFGFGSGSVTLDARAFSPFGVVSQSAILGATAFETETALRLDTTLRYDDEARGVTYQAGDIINAGLPWTRPLRLGGVQIQHDFGLRSDLVLGPSATVSGTAAVPSSADVFVNNFKIFSQPVDAGPFRIEDLPAIDGGVAELVLRDVTGKTTTEAVPFFVSSRLLAPGALDYSAEAGYARQYYRSRLVRLRPASRRQRLPSRGNLRIGRRSRRTPKAATRYNGGLERPRLAYATGSR